MWRRGNHVTVHFVDRGFLTPDANPGIFQTMIFCFITHAIFFPSRAGGSNHNMSIFTILYEALQSHFILWGFQWGISDIWGVEGTHLGVSFCLF